MINISSINMIDHTIISVNIMPGHPRCFPAHGDGRDHLHSGGTYIIQYDVILYSIDSIVQYGTVQYGTV